METLILSKRRTQETQRKIKVEENPEIRELWRMMKNLKMMRKNLLKMTMRRELIDLVKLPKRRKIRIGKQRRVKEVKKKRRNRKLPNRQLNWKDRRQKKLKEPIKVPRRTNLRKLLKDKRQRKEIQERLMMKRKRI